MFLPKIFMFLFPKSMTILPSITKEIFQILLRTLRWGDCLGLSGWAGYIWEDPYKKEAGRSESDKKTQTEKQRFQWCHSWRPRECTGHSKHPLPTTQEKTLHVDITRWSTLKSDRLYSFSQRWRSSIQSTKTRPEPDCGSDHECLIAKFRLKLKKVGKTTRPFRYNLNQIPYDYTVEVRNRFKGLDLIDCLMNYGWRFMTLYRRQGSRPSLWKRNAKKKTGCLRRPYK